MESLISLDVQAAAKIIQLEQHVQQLQYEANTAGALEYRCEGLQQDKQQLVQQLQQLKGTFLQPCGHTHSCIYSQALLSALRHKHKA